VHVLSDFDYVRVSLKNFILDLWRVLLLERGVFFFRVVRRSLERVLCSVLSAVSVQHVEWKVWDEMLLILLEGKRDGILVELLHLLFD